VKIDPIAERLHAWRCDTEFKHNLDQQDGHAHHSSVRIRVREKQDLAMSHR